MSDTVTMVTPDAAAPRERLPNVQQHAARLQAAFIQALTEEDVKAIARKLIEQARDGDQTSARLVLKYGLGQLLSRGATGGCQEAKATEGTKLAAAALTNEQMMAAVYARMAEQEALEAEILGRNHAGPAKPAGRGEAAGGRGGPPAARGR